MSAKTQHQFSPAVVCSPVHTTPWLRKMRQRARYPIYVGERREELVFSAVKQMHLTYQEREVKQHALSKFILFFLPLEFNISYYFFKNNNKYKRFVGLGEYIFWTEPVAGIMGRTQILTMPGQWTQRGLQGKFIMHWTKKHSGSTTFRIHVSAPSWICLIYTM